MRELTRILTLTPRRIGQLKRLDLLRGESGYTFRDLLALRAAGALLDAGASVRQMRLALDALRKREPDMVQPLAEVRLVLDGGRLLAQSDRAWLSRLVTRRESPAEFHRALTRQPDDIKVVIQFAEA